MQYNEQVIEFSNEDPYSFENITEKNIDKLKRNRFLQLCNSGQITLDQMKRFLVQHRLYSEHFTKYLCAAISNLDADNDPEALFENLFEERGMDDHHSESSLTHAELYLSMLEKMGIELNDYSVNPETEALINTTFSLCKQSGGYAGLGALCFGAEALVPEFYAIILKGLISCGVEEDKLEFFRLHIECDDGHAEALYDVILQNKETQKINLLVASDAADVVINARLRFLDALV